MIVSSLYYEYLPLAPGGFHNICEADFERLFVEPFGIDGRRRESLCKKFRAWLLEIKNIGLPLEMWIDGSFVTRKPEPGDIDIVCVMDSDVLRSLTPEAKERLSGLFKMSAVKSKYGCHVFAMLKDDLAQYKYWIKHFGHSRSGTPKGIFRIFLGGEN